MRISKLQTVAAALLLLGICRADTLIPAGEEDYLVVPSSSPVRFLSYNTDNLSASFEGSFVLTGGYVLGFHSYPTADHPDWGMYGFTFTVDPELVATLPRWDRFPEGPKEVDFDNFEDFVNAVVPAADLARLKRGEIKSYSGRVSARVDRYWTAKPCGYPEFKVHFLEVVKPPLLVAGNDTVEPRNC